MSAAEQEPRIADAVEVGRSAAALAARRGMSDPDLLVGEALEATEIFMQNDAALIELLKIFRASCLSQGFGSARWDVMIGIAASLGP